MKRSERPSWLDRAPFNLGSTKHGKMGADQWRTTCTVDLVITLVRLWGSAEGRFQDMLGNFMNMVTAVKIAHQRSTTVEDGVLYHSHMRKYLEEVLALYPGHDLAPNHHISLHLDDILGFFGPIQAWRCFPFERLNGILQNIPNNMKLSA